MMDYSLATCLLRLSKKSNSSSLLRIGAWTLSGLCYGQQIPITNSSNTSSSSIASNTNNAKGSSSNHKDQSIDQQSHVMNKVPSTSVMHEQNIEVLLALFLRVSDTER